MEWSPGGLWDRVADGAPGKGAHMSHITGVVLAVSPAVRLGPSSGSPATSGNTWSHGFAPAAAPGGTKLIVLHFRNVDLPAASRLEVDLGYGRDVFVAGAPAELWTRPINLAAFPDGRVPVRYIADGGTSGGAEIDRYGRGQRHAGDGRPSFSNSDPFLLDATYVEPTYDPFWFCRNPPAWENVACVADPDVRRRVARSVGMILSKHSHGGTDEYLSTCSVTLIDSDVVVTAGHCLTVEEAAASSIIFNYEVECSGARPSGYSGQFHKVKRVLRHAWSGSDDYCLLQIEVPPGGLGIPPIPMRADLPAAGEPVFGIHHPNGAVKKLAIPHPGFETVNSSSATGIMVDIDVSGGSSGSGLFDASGRFLGVCANGTACSLRYFPSAAILQRIAQPPGAAVAKDVAIVFDRSGSMSLPAGSGRTRIEEARDAASLFVQLVRAGGGNRVSLVSFSATASAPADFPRASVDAAAKTALVGPAPFSGGIVGGLLPGGLTTIGGGLMAGRNTLSPAGANARTILLLTDGLHNTPPDVAAAEAMLGDIQVNAIGFGEEWNLDGAMLTQLAARHGGLYTRAGSGLALRKFFALAFGNIFEAGALFDPGGRLEPGQAASEPIRFPVCAEEAISIVVGWDRPEVRLLLKVTRPDGSAVQAGVDGVEEAAGRTWAFLRVPLSPASGAEGEWSAQVLRVVTGGEFPNEAEQRIAVEYFVTVIAAGGPRLVRRDAAARRYYTGDRYNPAVSLLYEGDNGFVRDAEVKLTVTRPNAAAGDLLVKAAPAPGPDPSDEDALPPRYRTLAALQDQGQGIGYTESDFLLSGAPQDTGFFDHGGAFGKPLDDLFQVEGNYTFHARARFGDGCVATRELSWTVHVDVGIDPGRTEVRPEFDPGSGGRRPGRIVIVPRDRYGHAVGPGRAADIPVSGAPGTIVTGPVEDKGGGVYEVPVECDEGATPGLVVTQPGRDPVLVGGGASGGSEDRSCLYWIIAGLILALLLLLLLLLFS